FQRRNFFFDIRLIGWRHTLESHSRPCGCRYQDEDEREEPKSLHLNSRLYCKSRPKMSLFCCSIRESVAPVVYWRPSQLPRTDTLWFKRYSAEKSFTFV